MDQPQCRLESSGYSKGPMVSPASASTPVRGPAPLVRYILSQGTTILLPHPRGNIGTPRPERPWVKCPPVRGSCARALQP